MKTIFVISLLFIQLNLFSQGLLYNDASYYRGAITSERVWWDALKYTLDVTPEVSTKSIIGSLKLKFKVIQIVDQYVLQLDLQKPMKIDSVLFKSEKLMFNKIIQTDNAYFVHFDKSIQFSLGEMNELDIFFTGVPKEAKTPPWDGGWIWKKDQKNRDWISLACQGLGASVWFPCKDHQSDEPDEGMEISIHCSDNMLAVSNGRLISKVKEDEFNIFHWKVENPINLYDISVNIGSYVSYEESFNGVNGELNCQYWVLDYELEKAKKQFKQVPKLLKAFEYWFGAYPFYSDGYKVIQTPFLGMEHQSGIAYGNDFKNGYLSSDLSKTGLGLKFDFILIHESGHEWFGNNITSKDLADLWIHEAFTTYSEVLYLDYWYNQKSGNKYLQGLRNRIQNDAPIIAQYNLNEEGSGDMYFKGANLVHILRQLMKDDQKFKDLLHEMNEKYYHQTITSSEFEKIIQSKYDIDLTKLFDQYLRTIQIPTLEYQIKGNEIQYRWTNCVKGFNLPVKLTNGKWICPTDQIQTVSSKVLKQKKLEIDSNFYVFISKI